MPQPDMAEILLEALRYEHWLRYYFLDLPDEADKNPDPDIFSRATLRVPPNWLARSRAEEPHLAPLMLALQDREISLDTARESVFRHAAKAAGHDPDNPELGALFFELVSDPNFRRGLDAFHSWVQALADGGTSLSGALNTGADPEKAEEPAPFALWQQAFKTWEASEAVRHIVTLSPYQGE